MTDWCHVYGRASLNLVLRKDSDAGFEHHFEI